MKRMTYFYVILSITVFLGGLVHADHYERPRLLFSKADVLGVKERMKSDMLLRKVYDELIVRSDHILTLAPSKHEIKDGIRLLSQSRRALKVVLHTAMAWRFTREQKYLERAVAELDSVCGFADWNPSHFLDTAEMSTAVALGYDWLYDGLSVQQRERYSEALMRLGVAPARAGYVDGKRSWWSYKLSNWSQVCAAGLLIAERALENEGDAVHSSRLRAKGVLDSCRSFYMPDGGYPEGPSYWDYGTIYHVLGIDATRNNHPEMMISTPPEFKRSALFKMHMTGPSGYLFNFADSGVHASRSKVKASQIWIANDFKDSASIRFLRGKLAHDIEEDKNIPHAHQGKFFPLHLIWLPSPVSGKVASFPLDTCWKGVQPIAVFRESWDSADGMFMAIKGGLAEVSHGHMDIGSFVFESDGVRWIEDLGSDSYGLPGYFDVKKNRWNTFRLNNFSHNTLVVGNHMQVIDKGVSPITEYVSRPDKGHAVIDMSNAYSGQVAKLIRKAEFSRVGQCVIITDSVRDAKAAVRWAVVTQADVSIEGGDVILRRAGKKLKISRKDNHGGVWSVRDAKPPSAAERQNEGYRLVSFTVPLVKSMDLRVVIEPQ